MLQRYPLSESSLGPLEFQLLHPDYWDGHTLGDGDAGQMPPACEDLELNRAVNLAFEEFETLEGYSGLSLDTFQKGGVFDAANHAPGTIIGLDVESLTTARAFEGADPTWFSGQKPYVYQPMQTDEEPQILNEEHCVYIHESTLGIVMRMGRRTKLLHTVTLATSRQASQNTLVDAPTSITIGQASHTANEDGIEMFSRINEITILRRPSLLGKRRTSFAIGSTIARRLVPGS